MLNLVQHPGFTATYGVHRLVRFEMRASMEQAITREKQLKNWRRQWKLNLIEGDNPQWMALAVGLGLPALDHGMRHDGC